MPNFLVSGHEDLHHIMPLKLFLKTHINVSHQKPDLSQEAKNMTSRQTAVTWHKRPTCSCSSVTSACRCSATPARCARPRWWSRRCASWRRRSRRSTSALCRRCVKASTCSWRLEATVCPNTHVKQNSSGKRVQGGMATQRMRLGPYSEDSKCIYMPGLPISCVSG